MIQETSQLKTNYLGNISLVDQHMQITDPDYNRLPSNSNPMELHYGNNSTSEAT